MVVSMECTLRGIVFESQRQVWLPKGRSTTGDCFQTIFWNFSRKPLFKSLWETWKKKEVVREGPMTLKCARNGKNLCFWNKNCHKQYVIHAGSHSGHQSTAFSSQHRLMPSFPPGKCRHYSESGSPACSSVQFACLSMLRLDGSLCFWLIPSEAFCNIAQTGRQSVLFVSY